MKVKLNSEDIFLLIQAAQWQNCGECRGCYKTVSHERVGGCGQKEALLLLIPRGRGEWDMAYIPYEFLSCYIYHYLWTILEVYGIIYPCNTDQTIPFSYGFQMFDFRWFSVVDFKPPKSNWNSIRKNLYATVKKPYISNWKPTFLKR